MSVSLQLLQMVFIVSKDKSRRQVEYLLQFLSPCMLVVLPLVLKVFRASILAAFSLAVITMFRQTSCPSAEGLKLKDITPTLSCPCVPSDAVHFDFDHTTPILFLNQMSLNSFAGSLPSR